MTSLLSSACDLSDRDLLTELKRAANCERQATAHLVALLIEVDSRKLYAGQGCSSLFTYCVQRLHFSEHAAYLRIEAARLARRFPVILDRLSDGSLHLTAVSILGPHLTAGNHLEVLESAKHKSKRDVEHLVARLRPQPDVPASVRKLPESRPVAVPGSTLPLPALEVPVLRTLDLEERRPQSLTLAPPADSTPIAPERYKVQCTVSCETYETLRRVQDLLRHSCPATDLPTILIVRSRCCSLSCREQSSRPRIGHAVAEPR